MNNQALPHIDIVDMREELSEGNRSMFSNELRNAIQDRLDKQEQIVLFLIEEVMLPLCYVGIVVMYRNARTVIFL